MGPITRVFPRAIGSRPLQNDRNNLSQDKLDKLVKSRESSLFVIPANAGIQENQELMDPRSPIRSRTSFAGVTHLETFYETIKLVIVSFVKKKGMSNLNTLFSFFLVCGLSVSI